MTRRRHLTRFEENDKFFCFDLVVRTENNLGTFGGGNVRVGKPFTRAALETAIDDAVEKIVDEGNLAFPKDRLSDMTPAHDTVHARRLSNRVRQQNRKDWPSLGVSMRRGR